MAVATSGSASQSYGTRTNEIENGASSALSRTPSRIT